jgi:hypothetical protein
MLPSHARQTATLKNLHQTNSKPGPILKDGRIFIQNIIPHEIFHD